uniref:SIS domain-containing protein n=1 Tax=Algoriphagus sp. TaxID=1872435 RepID=UPI0040489F1C
MKSIIENYNQNLIAAFSMPAMSMVHQLAEVLQETWRDKKTVFICGNGGSAGNAIHLANDFNYGVDKNTGVGLRVDALPANQSIITCLANDEGYEYIYSQQLMVKASEGDVLIVLSGSGNSPNVIKALEVANRLNMKTFAILGFSGGKCKELAQFPLHFPIDDMQVSEDLQMIVGHMCMQWLSLNSNKK